MIPESEQPLVNIINMLLSLRSEPIIPWQGGFVYPRDEVRRAIRDLRRLRSYNV